ncbi:oxidoreductase [Halosimplex aquaticum]|uniref:Oxidoreductase n=1 Tax=Halosimplex aquaticum TaxID=3026162 RepID=A0ABD5Y2Z0_9EURY|nr:oxidoreductase [Halosimplex aquaticum]
MSEWTLADTPDLSGKTIVVTGANSGIGYEATGMFAVKGATVVMACRSTDRGERAADDIRVRLSDPDLDVRECDLADLSSVESFAEGVRADYDELHVLCNNAGVMAIPRSETADGFETQFGVNHLGHFALTGHLLDRLVETAGEARVVTQSSGVHERGEIDFADLGHEDAYGKWEAYAQSKLANVLFAYELQRRLDAAGIADTLSAACHPGYADTELQGRGPEQEGSTLKRYAMAALNAVFAQSAEKGTLPLVYAATAPEVDGGDYVGPGGLFGMRGHPEKQRSSDASYDREDAERLWTVSEDRTGVTYDFDALADVAEA